MSEIPPDLHYTAEHEWIRRTGDNTVRVGITDFAQSALGDVVFVQLPDVGTEVTAGESFGEVESTKSVSDLFAPVSAKVVAVNSDLDGNSQLVNSDPYGGGWLLDLEADSESYEQEFAALLDAEAYRAHTGRMTLVIVPARRRCARPRDACADPAREGALGSRARYGRHIDGHERVGNRSSGPTRQHSSRPVRSSG